jgi:hypothetical protein
MFWDNAFWQWRRRQSSRHGAFTVPPVNDNLGCFAIVFYHVIVAVKKPRNHLSERA